MMSEFLFARGWAMSSIILAQLAEVVPDLRVLAVTYSQSKYRSRLKSHSAKIGLIVFRGRRFSLHR